MPSLGKSLRVLLQGGEHGLPGGEVKSGLVGKTQPQMTQVEGMSREIGQHLEDLFPANPKNDPFSPKYEKPQAQPQSNELDQTPYDWDAEDSFITIDDVAQTLKSPSKQTTYLDSTGSQWDPTPDGMLTNIDTGKKAANTQEIEHYHKTMGSSKKTVWKELPPDTKTPGWSNDHNYPSAPDANDGKQAWDEYWKEIKAWHDDQDWKLGKPSSGSLASKINKAAVNAMTTLPKPQPKLEPQPAPPPVTQKELDRRGKNAWKQGYRTDAFTGGGRDIRPEAPRSSGSTVRWFARDPVTANTYVKELPWRIEDERSPSGAKPVMFPVKLKLGKTLTVQGGDAIWSDIPAAGIGDKEVIKKLYGKDIYEEQGKDIGHFLKSQKISTDSIVKVAKALGYDSVTFKNIRDQLADNYLAKPTDVFAVFRGDHVRGRFAKFSRANRGKADLLGGVAATVGTGSLAAAAFNEMRNQEGSV